LIPKEGKMINILTNDVSTYVRELILKEFGSGNSVAVMKAGKIVEKGDYKDLMQKKGTLYELVSGEK
jgi:ABC-type transport system involved in Fe-S cluster assembly fused permease/ATPase subunit